MEKKTPTTAVAAVSHKTADVGRFEIPHEVMAFAGGLGIDMTGTRDERANLAAEHMNRSQRHMLASGLLLASIKAECEHGEFTRLIEARGFEERAARKAMQYAEFIFTQPETQRLRLLEMPRSKVMEIAGADPEVIQALLEDGEQIDMLSVRALRQRIADLEAAATDLQTQRDTVEADAEGLRKRLKRGLPDRADGLPHAVADLRAEIMALGRKAQLALDGLQQVGGEIACLVGADASHDLADATLRLGLSQLAALGVQLNGLVKSYVRDLPGEDPTPAKGSYLSKQEVLETARAFADLAQINDYERTLREWEREQERPKGKGRPKARPVAPGATP